MARHRRRKALFVGVVAMLASLAVALPTAQADTISGIATTSGKRFRGGVPTAAGVYYASSVQVSRDAKGNIVNVRGAGRITKIRGAAVVQVDRVALGTAAKSSAVSEVRANSGAGVTAFSVTDWVHVAPRTCTGYRVRTNYSVRWSDGAQSAFAVLSPLVRVCGPMPVAPTTTRRPTVPPVVLTNPGNTKDCGDFATYPDALAWFRRYFPQFGDVAKLDADNDMIPCETLPGAP